MIKTFISLTFLLLITYQLRAQSTRLVGVGELGGGSIFSINEDGSSPEKWVDFVSGGDARCNDLIERNGKLWGMTHGGGIYGYGVIFHLDLDGTNYTRVHDFDGSLGKNPYGSLVASNDKLWGMTNQGGTNDRGVIFSLNEDGTNYKVIVAFDSENGGYPRGNLVEDNGRLWGMSFGGGTGEGDVGTIFSLDTDGTNFIKIHDFDFTSSYYPMGSLTIYDGQFWGMTSSGGANDRGVIFRLDSDGSNFTNVYDFDNTNGANPRGNNLVVSNGKFWGMTWLGGSNNHGTIFSLNVDGTNYMKVHDFDGINGTRPFGTLVESNGKFWGMVRGGSNDLGLLFSMELNGINYTKVHDFDDIDGTIPFGSLMESNNKLWGMTLFGGTGNKGTIFNLNQDGTNFEKVHDFDNGKGNTPNGSLIEINNKLWGTTRYGGLTGDGIVFNLNKDGSGYLKVHEFDGTNGSEPYGSLIESNGKIWGTTWNGGSNDKGTIFTLDIEGANFTKVHEFGETNGLPYGGLIESNEKIWGTMAYSGSSNYGGIFNLDIDGSGFTKVHDFGGVNGDSPEGGLVENNGRIWGTTTYGGTSGNGVIFNLDIDGSGFTKVHDFDDINGRTHRGKLIAKNGKFWGVAGGGFHNLGVLFNMDSDGSNYTKVHDFDGTNGSYPYGSFLVSSDKLLGVTYSGGANDFGVMYSLDTEGTTFAKVYDFDANTTGGNIRFPLMAIQVIDDQNLEFTLGDKTYGDEIITLVATSNSENPISYTSSDVNIMSIEDTSGTIKGAGEVTITASQEASDWYRAGSTSQTISINKAPLLAVVDSQSKNYGETNPEFTITYTGFVNGDSAVNLNHASVTSTLADEASDAGTYEINLSSGVDNNYDITESIGTLTINKADLTIIADNQSKTYGENNPELTISYDGFANEESATDLDSQPFASTQADETSDAGIYEITLTVESDANYSINESNGTLTIEKADLTLAAENKNMPEGGIVPELTLTIDGFVNEDTTADIGLPEISTDASSMSEAGIYEIILSGGGATNYTFILVNGILTIELILDVDTWESSPKTIVYPNPIYDQFSLTIDRGDIGVKIFNLNGVLVKQFEGYQPDYDINELPRGIYSLILTTGKKVSTALILKE